MGLGRSEVIFTVYNPEDLPKPTAPRWAVVGRSNVGKSTLLNALVHPQKFFRVGAKPGVTRGLIGVRVYLGQQAKSAMELVDLPGYGFALGAEKDAERWVELANKLKEQSNGALLWLWLVDPYRDPGVEDKQFLDWLGDEPFVFLFTKSDRHKPKQRAMLEAKWKGYFLQAVHPPIWVSAEKNESLNTLTSLAKNFLRQA